MWSRSKRGNRIISIHAPREGCDGCKVIELPIPSISIHAPREGCDFVLLISVIDQTVISIHAPREGCDLAQQALHRLPP